MLAHCTSVLRGGRKRGVPDTGNSPCSMTNELHGRIRIATVPPCVSIDYRCRNSSIRPFPVKERCWLVAAGLPRGTEPFTPLVPLPSPFSKHLCTPRCPPHLRTLRSQSTFRIPCESRPSNRIPCPTSGVARRRRLHCKKSVKAGFSPLKRQSCACRLPLFHRNRITSSIRCTPHSRNL